MNKFKYSGKPVRLSKAAERYAPEISYNYFKRLLEAKDIRVNNIKVNADIILSEGDEVVIYSKEQALKAVYEDGNIFVAYKPKGISSEGEGGFEDRVRKAVDAKLCHRLDTNTDGLLIFAKTEESYALMLEAFKQKYVEKIYTATVYGRVAKDAVLTGYLIKDAERGVVTVTDKPVRGAVKAITSIRVLEYLGDSTIIEASPITGKTHQIRAQLAASGHFVLGDGKYGRDDINRRFDRKKQQLTANKLKFCFPAGSKFEYLNKITITLEDKK